MGLDLVLCLLVVMNLFILFSVAYLIWKRKWKGLLLVVGVLLTVGLLVELSGRLVPVSVGVPSFAWPDKLEAKYAAQMDHLVYLAGLPEAERKARKNDPDDVRSFSPPEILEVRIGDSRNSQLVGNKVWFPKDAARCGRAVCNRRVCTLQDGSRVTIIEYSRELNDSNGKKVTIFVVFDLEKPKEALETRAP